MDAGSIRPLGAANRSRLNCTAKAPTGSRSPSLFTNRIPDQRGSGLRSEASPVARALGTGIMRGSNMALQAVPALSLTKCCPSLAPGAWARCIASVKRIVVDSPFRFERFEAPPIRGVRRFHHSAPPRARHRHCRLHVMARREACVVSRCVVLMPYALRRVNSRTEQRTPVPRALLIDS